MNSLEKEFVPYQEALELKELGFDEPCLGWYASDKSFYTDNKITINSGLLLAPLKQQAFRWFREKYGLSGWVNESFTGDDRQGVISIKSEIGLKYFPTKVRIYQTYEEAELACIRKLIEIVKNTKP